MLIDVPWPTLAAGLTLGVAGSVHCLAMCGGIAAAAGSRAQAAGPASRPLAAGLTFNGGRLAGYVLLGAAVGAIVGATLTQLPLRPMAITLRLVAALLMAALALQLLTGRDLLRLERIGGQLWRRVQPLAGKSLALPGTLRFAVLGMLWGFLPCGLVYSALALAAATGSAAGGALTMLAFGAGTLPSMLALTLAGSLASRRLSGTRLRFSAGLLMLVFAVWTGLGPLAPHAGHGDAGAGATDHASMHHH